MIIYAVIFGYYWRLTAFVCLKMDSHSFYLVNYQQQPLDFVFCACFSSKSVRQTQFPKAVKLALHVLVDLVSKTSVETTPVRLA